MQVRKNSLLYDRNKISIRSVAQFAEKMKLPFARVIALYFVLFDLYPSTISRWVASWEGFQTNYSITESCRTLKGHQFCLLARCKSIRCFKRIEISIYFSFIFRSCFSLLIPLSTFFFLEIIATKNNQERSSMKRLELD